MAHATMRTNRREIYGNPKEVVIAGYDDDDSFGELPPLGYVRFEYQIVES